MSVIPGGYKSLKERREAMKSGGGSSNRNKNESAQERTLREQRERIAEWDRRADENARGGGGSSNKLTSEQQKYIEHQKNLLRYSRNPAQLAAYMASYRKEQQQSQKQTQAVLNVVSGRTSRDTLSRASTGQDYETAATRGGRTQVDDSKLPTGVDERQVKTLQRIQELSRSGKASDKVKAVGLSALSTARFWDKKTIDTEQVSGQVSDSPAYQRFKERAAERTSQVIQRTGSVRASDVALAAIPFYGPGLAVQRISDRKLPELSQEQRAGFSSQYTNRANEILINPDYSARSTLADVSLASGEVSKAQLENLKSDIDINKQTFDELQSRDTKLAEDARKLDTTDEKAVDDFNKRVNELQFDYRVAQSENKELLKRYNVGQYATSFGYEQAGIISKDTWRSGLIESVVLGTQAGGELIKQDPSSYKKFEISGTAIEKGGKGLQWTGDVVYDVPGVGRPVGSGLTFAGTRLEKGGRYIKEKPGETVGLAILGTASLGAAATTLPTGLTGAALAPFKAGITSLGTQQIVRVASRGSGYDLGYSLSTKEDREILSTMSDRQLGSFAMAETQYVGTKSRIRQFAFDSVPFAEIIGLGNRQVYSDSARDFYLSKGYSQEEATKRASLATKQRYFKSAETGVRMVAVETISELSGGPLKGMLQRTTMPGGVGSRLGYVLSRSPTYAALGAVEGGTSSLIEQDRYSVTSYDYRQVGRGAMWGAVTAPVVGGIIDFTTVSGGLGIGKRDFPIAGGQAAISVKYSKDAVLGKGYSRTAFWSRQFTQASAYAADAPEILGDVTAGVIEKVTGMGAGPSIYTFGSTAFTKTSSAQYSPAGFTGQTVDVTPAGFKTTAPSTMPVSVQQPTKSMVSIQQQSLQMMKSNVPVQVESKTFTPTLSSSSSTKSTGLALSQTSAPVQSFNTSLSVQANVPVQQQTPIMIKQPAFVPMNVPVQQNTMQNTMVNQMVQTNQFVFTPKRMPILPLLPPGGAFSFGWGESKDTKKRKLGYQASFGAIMQGVYSNGKARLPFGEVQLETKRKKGDEGLFSLYGIRPIIGPRPRKSKKKISRTI